MVARGGWLLLLLMLGLTVYDLGRVSFLSEESPALRVSGRQGMQILLLDNAARLDGIHQINDASQLLDVINLAGISVPTYLQQELLGKAVIIDGKMLIFHIVDGAVVSVDLGWMPAAMRMSLGIPLHVNRMSGTDWDDLPGVGPSLALRIENDRHKNGDFGSLKELQRVKGVGLKRIAKWKPFFTVPKLLKNSQKVNR